MPLASSVAQRALIRHTAAANDAFRRQLRERPNTKAYRFWTWRREEEDRWVRRLLCELSDV